MRKKPSREKIVYGLLAALLFALLAAATFRTRADRLDRRQVQVAAFGDSTFGTPRNETSILSQVEELAGISIYNAAFGGTCASRIDYERRLDYSVDALSLAGLAKAVYADDFGVQQTTKSRENGTEFFGDFVDELERIDFSSVELVLIDYGINDYYVGVPIRNEEDPYDEYTFTGALRSALNYLRRVNPNMRIVLVTPTYSWLVSAKQTCEEYDAGGGIQEDYVRAEMELAQELGIEVIDVYHDVYPHEKWEDWTLYTMEGIHPNEAARELLANIIADYLKGSGEEAVQASE